jgi:type IV pilus assembly protein PilY1
MNIRSSLFPALLGALLAFTATMPSPLHADDTDLYVHPNFTGGGDEALPHIMFTLDYRSNLGSTECTNPAVASCTVTAFFINYAVTQAEVQAKIDANSKITFFDLLRWSLKVVFSQYSGFKASLMVSHSQSNNCAGPGKTGCSNGAYVLQGFEDMGDAAHQDDFHETLGYMKDPGGALAHSYQLKEMLFEFYRYLKGWDVYNGHNGYIDWNSGGNPNVNRNVGAANDQTNNNHLLGWDTTIESGGTTYISPLGAESNCTKMFAIHFIFGVTNQEDDSDAAIKKTANATDQGMGLTNLSNGTNGAIEMVSYMKNNDLSSTTDGTQSVTQYFVTNATSTNIRQLAAAGGTTVVEIGSDPQDLVDKLGAILQEILSVSTTFVSASVPVNVFNRAESLDNVFIALFQADEDKHPFWDGNVKKLKLKLETIDGEDVVSLVDSSGAPAIANDGRIKHESLTFWTNDKTLPAPTGDEVEEKDGRGVARGAAGQRMPGFQDAKPTELNADGFRKLYYDKDADTLVDLDATAAVATDLVDEMGLGADTATALEVIQFSRGFDPLDDEGDGDKSRAWWFGDPLHSRPLPINYGLADSHSSDANPLIYIAVGTNDGYMRFIRNSLPSNDDTADGAGEEVWAFMPKKVMANVATMYQNRASPIDHPYGVDGPPTSYTIDVKSDGTVDADDGDKVYLYFGLRRGGRAMYALDVTDPENPDIAWRLEETDSDFTELGYTFSPPKVGKINLGEGDIPIVAFAGGYDLNKDARVASTASGAQTAAGSDDTYGNAFYVVHAETGELIFKATKGASTGLSGNIYKHTGFKDSVPSEIALLDGDGDGYTDRAVFGDSGGNVWRVDMGSPNATQDDVENWRLTLIARTGRHYNNDINDDRRYFHRPDVVPSKDATGNFDAIVIGSGNRENPLDRSTTHTGDSLDDATTDNFMYVIKDRKTSTYVEGEAAPTVLEHDDLFDVTSNCLGGAVACGDTTSLANGWKLQLNVGPGEKSLSSPVTVTNTVFFTTFLPLGTDADVTTTDDGVETATCGPQEGKGLLYAIDLADATPVTNFNVSRDSVQSSESDATDRYSVLASAGIPADVVTVSLGGQTYVLPPDLKPSDVEASTRWRTFWYQVDEDDGP